MEIKITDDVRYIGVNDHDIDLFEGQYIVPNGMAYNSYVILDQKTAVIDTADAHFTKQWLDNLSAALEQLRQRLAAEDRAEAEIVASAKAFAMMSQFFGTDFAQRRVVVGEGDTLSLGRHELTFVTAPMVHWPEVTITYDSFGKILFSADAFGKFGATDTEEEWDCEARRYYFGIVGKYGAQVQRLLQKAAGLDIKAICPAHGPVLTEDLEHYLGLYDIWSSYRAESEGVMIAYTSVYGHTEEAAKLLAERLKAKGCPRVAMADLARDDMAEAVEDAFRHSKLVLATTTYNADIFPPMRTFIDHLTERGYQNRTVALIENGSWAPTAAKVMRAMLEPCKNISYAETSVKLLSALNDESRGQIEALADELC